MSTGAGGSGNTGAGSAENEEDSRLKDLAAISLTSKIADFWQDRPSLWFVQAEAMLAPQKLSDQVKFNLVITKLGKDVIGQVTDLLLAPPPTGKYQALKNRLIQVFEETENRQLQKLISEMELGDQKPSQLLRRMKELARNKIGDDTLSVLWQGHLPTSVRTVLAVANIKELDNLAEIADKIMENSKPLFVSEVSNNQTPSSAGSARDSTASNSDAEKILKEIAKLNVRISKFEHGRSRSKSAGRYRGGRGRSVSRNRNSRRPRRTEDSPDWLCFYHYKYADKATKCVEPCNWKKQQGN